MTATKEEPPKDREKRDRLLSQKIEALVLDENERLNRLIQNLYMKFRLDRYPEAELYNHICREVAQYVHASCCSLLLLRHGRDSGPEKAGQDQEHQDDRASKEAEEADQKRYEVKETLQLVGAFGPWQAALEPRHHHEKTTLEYRLDKEKRTLTTEAYFRRLPTLLRSRQHFILIRQAVELAQQASKKKDAKDESPTDQERHLIWRYINLYWTCRNLLWVPIRRQPEAGTREIGLLKLENRTPRGIEAFAQSAGTRELKFERLWSLAALLPYITDLSKSDAVFRPVHDNEVWRLRYQDNELGLAHFETVRRWLAEEESKFKKLTGKDKEAERAKKTEKIKKKYKVLRRKLGELVLFLSEAETLVQNMLYATKVLSQCESRSAEQISRETPPAPAFFNAHNLALACTKAKPDDANSKEANGEHSAWSGLGIRLIRELGEYLGAEAVGFVDEPLALIERTRLALFGGKEQQKRDTGPKQDSASKQVPFPADYENQQLTLYLRNGEIKQKGREQAEQENSPTYLDWDYVAACRVLATVVIDVSKRVRDYKAECDKSAKSRKTKQAPTPEPAADPRVQLEEDLACRIADEILRSAPTCDKGLAQAETHARQWLNEWLRRGRDGKAKRGAASESDDAGKLVKETESAIILLAELSDKSCMGAHTFGDMDAYRLVALSGHICQVLDNNLMQQARQRHIPTTYSDFALLGLTRDSLVWLKRIETTASKLARTLNYRINRDLRRDGVRDFEFCCQSLDLTNDVLGPLRKRAEEIWCIRSKDKPGPKGSQTTPVSPDKKHIEITVFEFGYDKRLNRSSSYRCLQDYWTPSSDDKYERQWQGPPRGASARMPAKLRVRFPLAEVAKAVPGWLLSVEQILDELEKEIDNV